jgi:hypothetical protein
MDELKKTYRVAVIVGLALMAGLFVYAGVVELVPRDRALGSEPALTKDQLLLMKGVLVGLSVLLYFAIALVRDRMAPAPRLGRPLSEAEAVSVRQRLLVASIVSFALAEAPASAGLVLFFLGGDPLDYYLFMVIALFLFSRAFPRFRDWEERLGPSLRS